MSSLVTLSSYGTGHMPKLSRLILNFNHNLDLLTASSRVAKGALYTYLIAHNAYGSLYSLFESIALPRLSDFDSVIWEVRLHLYSMHFEYTV